MGRLIAVSNRVSPPRDPGEGSQGGLAMALSAALRKSDGLWFGWSGDITPEFTGQLKVERVHGVTVATVDLEEQDREEYYEGYANATLWPLFHYRIGLTDHDRAYDQGYRRVNERFAETLSHLIAPDDTIWVHDYQLMLLPRLLREHLPDAAVVFDRFHVIKLYNEKLSDLRRQVQNGAEAMAKQVLKENAFTVGRTNVVAADVPCESDGDIRVTWARSPDDGAGAYTADVFERIRGSLAGRRMIVGVDRLDYSKGIEERFLGYDRFLTENPSARETVFMLQIATLSRDGVGAYQDLRGRLDAAAGRVNGAHATFDWVPLRYVNSVHRRDELAGIYRAAHVGLVTPLRDGMNLVAKEYVAAQDPEDPGVLVLSRFAGAAAQMREALIVNPFSREEIATAIARALAMPLEERVARWRALAEGVMREDVFAWSDGFLSDLSAPDSPTAAAA